MHGKKRQPQKIAESLQVGREDLVLVHVHDGKRPSTLRVHQIRVVHEIPLIVSLVQSTIEFLTSEMMMMMMMIMPNRTAC